MLLAMIPLPMPEMTPPVTRMYFIGKSAHMHRPWAGNLKKTKDVHLLNITVWEDHRLNLQRTDLQQHTIKITNLESGGRIYLSQVYTSIHKINTCLVPKQVLMRLINTQSRGINLQFYTERDAGWQIHKRTTKTFYYLYILANKGTSVHQLQAAFFHPSETGWLGSHL